MNDDISAKLDTLIRLAALTAIKDEPTLRERALKLSRAGLTPKEIAAICDTTPNTVSVALSAAKREASSSKKANKGGSDVS